MTEAGRTAKHFRERALLTEKTGSPMTCTGCGIDAHLYQACINPNKASFRSRRLQDIANDKNIKRQNQDLRSFCFQTSDVKPDAEPAAQPEKHPEADHRHVADDIDKKIETNMFEVDIESSESDSSSYESFYSECLMTHTRHVFFGSTETLQKSRGNSTNPKSGWRGRPLRYPAPLFSVSWLTTVPRGLFAVLPNAKPI